MKKKVHKIYYDYVTEEKWLNEMSAKGLALIDYNWATYTFEDSRPGEYTYRIELLDSRASHPISQKYLEFLEDSGVEVVATFTWWAFLRKRTEDGPFEIYSDNASRIAQLKKVSRLWASLGAMELFIGLTNVTIGLWPRQELGQIHSPVNVFLGLLLVGIAIGFFTMNSRTRKNLKRLQKEVDIQES